MAPPADRPHDQDPDHSAPHGHGEDCCGHGHDHDHDHGHDHGHDHAHSHGHSHDTASMGSGVAVMRAVTAAFPWSRLAPCFLLLLWGGVMIYFFASGRVVHYLTGFGGFRIQALICGLLLCVLAFFELLVRDSKASDCAACDGDHDHHDHVHGSADGAPGGWVSKAVTFLILAVPLAAAALFTPDRFSDQFFINKANAVTSVGTTALSGGAVDLAKRAEQARTLSGATADGTTGAPTNPNAFTVQELERLAGGRTPEGNIPLQLVELFYMPAQTRDVQEVVTTQTIETTGQAIKDKQDPTKFRLFRLMMTCCAADARPISIPIEFTEAPAESVREMGWYKATGTVEYREINGSMTTVFKASAITPTKPPRQQMLY